MPELLKQNYREQLTIWIGKTCHFRLLYKISRDGCSATTFHQKCDGKGPTVTVLYNTNNTIFGGYLSQSWNSNTSYISDARAFLFRLQYNGSSNPLKAPVNSSNYDQAGLGNQDYGPSFGCNSDLRTFRGNISKSGKEFALNGCLNMNNNNNLSYGGQNTNTLTNNNLRVTDLEVYLVVDGQGPKVFDKPWREPPEWKTETSEKLRLSLVNYKPMEETNVTLANILLIGQIGAGKSSFFNSVNSIFRGKSPVKLPVGVLSKYRQYKIKDFTSREFLNFRLCDTRGLEEDFNLDGQEMSYILDGHIPDRYQFNPLVPFKSDTPGYIKDPDLQDKIHCVAFVIDGSTVDVMSDKVRKQMKDLQVKLNQRKRVAEIMGLPRGHVFPVKNYESETKLKTGVDILVMEALQQCLDFADDFMDEQLDKMASEGKIKKKETKSAIVFTAKCINHQQEDRRNGFRISFC